METMGLKMCSFFVVLWLTAMALSNGYRMSVFVGSMIFGLSGPFLEYWHLQDYWHPQYSITISIGPLLVGLEDFIFCFCFSGSCIAAFLMGRTGGKIQPELTTIGVMTITCIIGLVILLIGVIVANTGVNSLYVVTASAIAWSLVFLAMRPKWVSRVLLSAGSITIIMWCFYAFFALKLDPDLFSKFWKEEALSGHMIFGVPLEELLWAGSFAMVIGPSYVFCLEWGRKMTLKGKVKHQAVNSSGFSG